MITIDVTNNGEQIAYITVEKSLVPITTLPFYKTTSTLAVRKR